MTFHSLDQVIDTLLHFNLIEVGTVILVKQHDQEIGDNWTLLGDDIVDRLREKLDISQFTGLHQKTVQNLHYQLRSLPRLDVFGTAPSDLKDFQRDLSALITQLEANNRESTDSDKAYDALLKLGIEINKPNVACPIEAINERYNDLSAKYPLLKLVVNTIGHYQYDNRDSVRNLKHYFSLLVRPEGPVVPESEDTEEDDDFDVDVDFDEDDGAEAVFGQAA
jgi:hypothetical protein